MKYDFETVLDRYDNGSVKWNLMKKKKPQVERGIVPFSIADMEFKNPPEIVEALKDCLDQGVLGYQTAEPSWYEAVTGWTGVVLHDSGDRQRPLSRGSCFYGGGGRGYRHASGLLSVL